MLFDVFVLTSFMYCSSTANVLVVIKVYSSSHPEVFIQKGVLKICSKFTEEHSCRSAVSTLQLY